jgi:hypothetical protein
MQIKEPFAIAILEPQNRSQRFFSDMKQTLQRSDPVYCVLDLPALSSYAANQDAPVAGAPRLSLSGFPMDQRHESEFESSVDV